MGHHTVPQRYLKNFESPDKPGCIWMFDKQLNTGKFVPIKVAVQSRAFYSQEIETALAIQVEKPANIVIAKILRGEIQDESIGLEDRTALSYYMATMIRRVPKSRKRDQKHVPGAIAVAAEKARALVEQHKREGRIRDIDVPAIFVRIEEWEQRALKEHPQEVRQVIETPWPLQNMLTVIHNMYWRILRCSGSSKFMASDNPATFFEGGGLGALDCELILPLSSDLLLHCSQQDVHIPGVHIIEEKVVKELNKRTAAYADRFLFYHEQADWIPEVAKNKPEQVGRLEW